MFKYVHHIEYLVNNCDAMMDYLEKNFGMKPDHTEVNKKGREAHYNVGKTQIQMLEPSDPTCKKGKYLAKHGPGVTHVAWGVDDLHKVAQELSAKGVKVRELVAGSADKHQVAIPGTESHDYRTFDIDLATSHGVQIQLVGPK